MTLKMNISKKILKINIRLACTGEEISSIIVDRDIIINCWFNKFIKDKYNIELKESDIKIMIYSLHIYSYYDQSIGNLLFNKIDLFSTDKDLYNEINEIHEIHVSLYFSPIFIIII